MPHADHTIYPYMSIGPDSSLDQSLCSNLSRLTLHLGVQSLCGGGEGTAQVLGNASGRRVAGLLVAGVGVVHEMRGNNWREEDTV